MNTSTHQTTPSSSIHFGLSDRVCIVTGGAQGIGAACAQRFAREAAKVVVTDVNDAVGQALAGSIGATYIHCDVGNKTEVDALVTQVMQQHGRIDVLVNNAGIFKVADFLDIAEADFDAVLRVNVKGAFLMGQAVAREMARQGSGSIINMSSVNSVLAIPNLASYNVSKGGINQLTRVMALSLADKGVRVNAVAPGTIATELAAKAVLTSEEAKARVMSRTPMKRLGTPEEVADAVAWLASDASSYVTADIITIDGGRMALNYTVPV
ncbi:SDR family NAD(P)-dependent oxidoreductase [Diaphorobacter aerolatus]|uniref:SDR family oxidoreductase n=1 Tax=Diaphorobacter aerolatus TaxID=1288495 RepID=A0A7H0GKX2_9BURK|nr:SDR family oxidoreductase [Diaphorobacter aerolatus]QNP48938.1 SDR family oxidoreductase [Diaphorobacter aerolatus]